MTTTNNINNLNRLKMEIKGINKPDHELTIYLLENGLNGDEEYDPTSNSNLKQIYQTALAILESIANDPTNYKNYKTEDISVSMFSKNLMERIDYLNRKIRMMPSDDDDYGADGGATIGYLFTE